MALSLAARRFDAAIHRYFSSTATRFSAPPVPPPPPLPVLSRTLPNLEAIAAALRGQRDEDVARHLGGRLTLFLFLKVIRSLREADCWVVFFDWAGSQQGFLHTAVSCNALLELLERSRRNETIVVVFGRIFSQHQCPPNALSYCYIAKALCRTGKIERACETIAVVMAKEKMVADVYTYNVVIDALFKLRDVPRAINFFETMPSPDVVTYNTMIGGLCKNGRVAQACSLFSSMDTAGIRPNDVTYTVLIDVFCKMGQLETAYDLLQLMATRKCPPTVFSYCSIINGLCKSRKVDQAYEIFEEMKMAGIKPDRVTYNTLIHGLCVKHRLHDAKDLLTVMVENGFQPDQITFTALIEGLCSADQLREACVLFEGMAKQGCVPDLVTYTVLVSKLCIRRKLRLAFRVVRNYPACPDAVILYTPVFRELGRRRAFDRAGKLLEKMAAAGVPPNVVTYTAFFKGMCDWKEAGRAYRAFRRMLERGIEPDLVLYNVLVDGFCKADKVAMAEKMVRYMDHSGLHPNVVTFNTMISHHCRKGDVGPIGELLHAMFDRNCYPDVATCSTLVMGLFKVGQAEAAYNFLNFAVSRGYSKEALGFKAANYAITLLKTFAIGSKTISQWILSFREFSAQFDIRRRLLVKFADRGSLS